MVKRDNNSNENVKGFVLGPTARGIALSPRPFSPSAAKISSRPQATVASPRYYQYNDQSLPATPVIADSKLSLAEIEDQIATKVKAMSNFIKQGFTVCDEHEQGSIQPKDFRRGFENFLFPITDKQFEQIKAKLPHDINGNIKYIEFLEKYGARFSKSPLPNIGSQLLDQENVTQFYTLDEIEKIIQEKAESKRKPFLKALRMCDYNKDGKIQKHEFRRIIDNFCMRLTDAQFVKLWSKYAGSTSAVIDYVSFLTYCNIRMTNSTESQKSPPKAKSRYNVQYKTEKSRYHPIEETKSKTTDNFLQGKSLQQIESEFIKRIRDNYNDLWSTFCAMDDRNDGLIALDQLQRIIGSFIFPMPDNLFVQLMNSFGFRATGRMPWKHFLLKFQGDAVPANGQTLPIKPSHKYNPIMESQQDMAGLDIWKLLNSKIKDGYTSINQAFLSFDDDKDGKVSHKEMRRIIEKFCFRLTEGQFRAIINRLDPDNDGYISYKKFMDIFEERESEEGHKWLKSNHRFNETRKLIAMTWEKAEDLLRVKISESWKSLAKAFNAIDTNQDGAISRTELKRLLEDYAIAIPEEHFETFWNRCDINDDGTIQFEEFVIRLGLKINEGDIYGTSTKIHDESDKVEKRRLDDQAARLGKMDRRAQDLTGKLSAEMVMKKLQDSVTQSSTDIRRVFQKYDKNADGKVSESEFRQVIAGMGLLMEEDQFKKLVKQFGFYKGNLSYSDFVETFEHTTSPLQHDLPVQLRPSQKYKPRIQQNISMTADEVEMKLRNKMRDGFQGLREAFYKIDDDHNGAITKSEFRRLLDSMMFVMKDDEFEKLMKRINYDNKSTLSYQEFLERFQGKEGIEAHPWLFSTHRFNKTKESKNLTHEQVHSLLLSKAENQWNDIAKAFRTFDKDGNGAVSKAEFHVILEDFALKMSDEEFEKLWAIYDTDNSGAIDYREFITRYSQTLAPGDEGISHQITNDSQNRLEHHHKAQKAKHDYISKMQLHAGRRLTAEEVEARLTDRFRDGFPSFRKAFENADKNKDGLVSRKELHDILRLLNFHIDEIEYNKFLDNVGLGNKIKLTYQEFLNIFQRGKQPELQEVIPKRASPISYDNLTPEKAELKLRQFVKEKFSSIVRALEAFDVDDNGRLIVKRFRKVLDNFCFKLTDSQYKHLLRRLGVSGEYVSYRDAITSLSKSEDEQTAEWLKQQDELLLGKFKTGEKIDEPQQDTSEKGQFIGIVPELDNNIKEADEEENKRLLENNATIEPLEPPVEYSPRELPDRQSPNEMERILDRNPSRNGSVALSPSRMSVASQSTRQIEKYFQQFVISKFYDLVKSFRRIDPSTSGFVYKSDFAKIMKKDGLSLDDIELEKLWKKLDKNDENFVDYEKMLRFYANQSPTRISKLRTPSANRNSPAMRPIAPTPRGGNTPTKLKVETGIAALVDAGSTEKLMKDKIVRHWKSVRKAFTQLDFSGSGYVDQKEFRDVLAQHKVILQDEQLMQIWDKYSTNDRAKLNYAEFLSYFVLNIKTRNEKPNARAILPVAEVKAGDTSVYLADVFVRIKDAVKQQWKNLRRSCKAYDSSNTGYVNQLQFRDILHQHHIDISEDDFFQLMVYYNRDLSDKIHYNEFLKQCLMY